ncbi:MAG: hypothetical protein ABIG71_03040 [Candidatus Uhrbacteria bacterium]
MNPSNYAVSETQSLRLNVDCESLRVCSYWIAASFEDLLLAMTQL